MDDYNYLGLSNRLDLGSEVFNRKGGTNTEENFDVEGVWLRPV